MGDSKKTTDSPTENKVIDLKVNRDDSKIINSKFSQYQPNEELLQATARIKKQRDIITDRIEKMRAASSKVTRSVFDKVFRDYNLQLQTITILLNEKKDGLKKEIKDLYMRREKITVEINRHREILEEAEFRHYLGEFSQTQSKEVENFETKEIEKLESDLAHIAQFIRNHEDLFDPQDLSLPQERKSSDVTKTVRKEISKPKIESTPKETPITDFEDLFLDEEDEETESKLEESQNSIQKILDENAIHVGDTADNIILSNNDSNYFKKNTVVESSLGKPRGKNISVDLEKTPIPIKKTDLAAQKTADKEIPTPSPASLVDDSISEILSSIKIEDNQTAAKKTQKEPEAASEYILTLIEGEHENKNFFLKENTAIGRSPSNDIVLKAPKVSRQHAAINVYNNQHIIIDLKSSNGVYVNGAKIDECILKPGDEISIGGYKFLFVKNPKG